MYIRTYIVQMRTDLVCATTQLTSGGAFRQKLRGGEIAPVILKAPIFEMNRRRNFVTIAVALHRILQDFIPRRVHPAVQLIRSLRPRDR
jgi:hypothetical protein